MLLPFGGPTVDDENAPEIVPIEELSTDALEAAEAEIEAEDTWPKTA